MPFSPSMKQMEDCAAMMPSRPLPEAAALAGAAAEDEAAVMASRGLGRRRPQAALYPLGSRLPRDIHVDPGRSGENRQVRAAHGTGVPGCYACAHRGLS